MKILKYTLGGNPVEMGWNEANEAVAKGEADKGAYTVVDDGAETISPPTRLDTMEAQLAYTAMMTDTLLEV